MEVWRARRTAAGLDVSNLVAQRRYFSAACVRLCRTNAISGLMVTGTDFLHLPVGLLPTLRLLLDGKPKMAVSLGQLTFLDGLSTGIATKAICCGAYPPPLAIQTCAFSFKSSSWLRPPPQVILYRRNQQAYWVLFFSARARIWVPRLFSRCTVLAV